MLTPVYVKFQNLLSWTIKTVGLQGRHYKTDILRNFQDGVVEHEYFARETVAERLNNALPQLYK